MIHKECIIKYLQKRSNTYYYRRRVPLEIQHLSSIRVILRLLSSNKKLALFLVDKYNNLFNMIGIGLKLDKDVSDLAFELGLASVPQGDMYRKFIDSHEVGKSRLQKIQRVLDVVKVLLPNDFSKIDMQLLSDVRNKILHLPKRNLAKYKDLSLHKIVLISVPQVDRLTAVTVKDYIVVLNAFLKFLYEMDIVNRHYSVKNVTKTTDNREDRVSLTLDTITKAIEGAKTAKLASSFILLYLTGMRPSEARLCKINTIDGIKCFDLTDTSIKLKTNASRRVIPVHRTRKNARRL